MSCGQLTNASEKHLVATSTVVLHEWFTPWMSAVGLDKVQTVLKAKSAGANFKWQPCMQVALVRTDNPGDVSNLGTQQTSSGEYTTTVQDISTTTASKMYARFGVAYTLGASATTPEEADLSFQMAYDQCGSIVGAWANNLVASAGTTGLIVAVSDRLPTMRLSKVKPAFVINSATTNFRARLVYRLAGTSKESPGAWSTLGSLLGSGESCPGDLTPTIGTTDFWIQFGVEYASNDANSAQGFVAAAIGVRK